MQFTKFESIDQLEKTVLDLDVAESRNVFIQDEKGFLPANRYRTVWNANAKSVSCIASDEYTILQHKDAFLPLVQALRYMGQPVHGEVMNSGDHVRVNVLFSDQKILPGTKDEIMLGVRFSNSFNSKGRFVGSGYVYRQICTNGMMGFGVMGRAISAKHIGAKILIEPQRITKLLVEIIAAQTKMDTKIKEAINDYVNVTNLEEYYKSIGFGKRIAKKLVGICENPFNPSRWDIYNSITDYATHKAKSEDSAESYQKIAISILNKGVKK